MKLFEQLAAELSRSIRSGVLRSGDRLPSVRELADARSVSIGTVLQAYGMLEDQGMIAARQRPGSSLPTEPPKRGR
ncbi:MAG: GntR family transcriptional regulator, partial [Myxococcota bacterium]